MVLLSTCCGAIEEHSTAQQVVRITFWLECHRLIRLNVCDAQSTGGQGVEIK